MNTPDLPPPPAVDASKALDAFGLFGFEPVLRIDRAELEKRYVELSRVTHPDHQDTGNDPGAIAEILSRSAQVNEAYRILRATWRRAEHLVEVLKPGVMNRTKALPPDFLMEAMEVAEEVEAVSDDSARSALRTRLNGQIEEYENRLEDAIEGGRIEHAAVLLHEASYYRKALHDLDR